MAILIGITVNYTVGENGIIKQSEEVRDNIEIAKNEGQQKIDQIKSGEDAVLDGAVSRNDTEAPTANNIEITNITENSFTVNLNVTETNSGIKTVKYSIDDGKTWTDEERKYSYTFRNVSPWYVAYNVQIKTEDEAGNTKTYTDTTPGVRIPDGFVWVGGTKESGLVISDNLADKDRYHGKDDVGNDLQGNQFVWIPVEDIADYKRTAYAANIATGIIDTDTNSEKINYNSTNSDYYTEALLTVEKASVEANKGYYIGRYEAGDKESTNLKTLRTSSSSTSNTVVVKAGQTPYNYVTKTQAQGLAEDFSKKQGYTSVKTRLVSSYAWDTAIAFIQKSNSDYGSCSEEGNYNDTTFTYTDITGVSQTKANGDSTLIPTGQTTAVNNIYDMGGNIYEWTTEMFSYSNEYSGRRGGNFKDNFAVNPSGHRGNRKISDIETRF